MVDFAVDCYKNLYPDEEVPERMNRKAILTFKSICSTFSHFDCRFVRQA
jgi:hypothetical protein